MSFFSNIKRAFGFDAGEDDFEDMTDDVVTHGDGVLSEESAESATQIAAVAEEPVRPVISPDIKARIFDKAVGVFNEALPDFLRRSVDPEAQSRCLAEALDSGVEQYLDSLVAEAQTFAEARLKNAADSAHAESERLRKEMECLEQQRTNLSEQKLSADRRHRALVDRVNDLETQLAASEAEKEQLDLEKRSLLNKLKVADVQPGMVEKMAAEIERLKARLEAEGGGHSEAPVPSEDVSALTAENETLRADAEAMKTKLEQAEKEARETLDTARADVENARAAADTAWEQANEARAAAEKAQAEMADMRVQQETVQGMYNDLHARYGQEKEAREKAEGMLAEAKSVADSVNELQDQMSQVEDVIRKRDERIAKLKAANKRLREQVATLEETLRSALPHDDGLFGLPSESAPTTDKNVNFSHEAMAALEEDFECPEWFVSEPAPGETSPLLTSDAEFGYQEPPKKARKPENDAQLSLF